MSATPETRTFQTETRQILDLMVHSLYSHREIFLRELVSNGSDALDKLRFESLSNPELLPADTELAIELELDAEQRTLTVSDNGIGMSRDEVISQIGTIAKSGTRELWQKLRESGRSDLPGELIGQFGVGFYSAFMVADRVVLVTRRAGEESATRWESTGAGEYTLSEAERDRAGTSVTLYLRPADPEVELDDFADPAVVKRVIKTYSDFVRYPIRLGGETLNSMKAIWRKPRSEVSQDEYDEFYKHVAHDLEPPLDTITFQAEGRFEYQALLYIPARAPYEFAYPTFQYGPQLYVRNVKIMDHCEALLPRYLRFVRGVVDSADLPLNVSREILQNQGQLKVLRQGLTRKILDGLKSLKEDRPEDYRKFWGEFGRVVKEGVAAQEEQQDRLLPLLLFPSSHDPETPTTLQEYVERMKEGQEEIFYLTGESRQVIAASPQLEAFRAKGYEVLYLDDAVDEFVVEALPEFAGHKLKSAGKGTVDLAGGEEDQAAVQATRDEQAKEYSGVLLRFEKKLADHVKEVRLSSRLTDSAVCLVGDEHDLSPQMRRLLERAGLYDRSSSGRSGAKEQGHMKVPQQLRIMELNPDHPVCLRLKQIYRADSQDPRLDDYAEILLGQAFLAEGALPPDPARYTRLVAGLMAGESAAPPAGDQPSGDDHAADEAG